MKLLNLQSPNFLTMTMGCEIFPEPYIFKEKIHKNTFTPGFFKAWCGCVWDTQTRELV